MTTVETYLEKKLTSFRALLLNQELNVVFNVKKVMMGVGPTFVDQDFMDLVGMIKPSVIDWSNIPDYFL